MHLDTSWSDRLATGEVEGGSATDVQVSDVRSVPEMEKGPLTAGHGMMFLSPFVD